MVDKNVTGVTEVPVVVKEDGTVLVLEPTQVNGPGNWDANTVPGTPVNEDEYKAKQEARKQRRLYIIGAVIIVPLIVVLLSNLF